MTVRAYRTEPFKTTHENRQFDALFADLLRVWGDESEMVLLFGNFYCHGSEIDAAVVRRNSITVIDFKDYEGAVTFSENSRWLTGDTEIKAGNKLNPYLQIRDNKFALLRLLEDTMTWPSGRRPNLGHISGMVLFRGPITFDEQRVPRTIASWFHVVDMAHATERLSQITSREIDLSRADLETIAGLLAVPEYTPVGSSVKAPTPNDRPDGAQPEDLPPCLSAGMRQVSDFLQSDKRVLIVQGMMGTGTDILRQAITHQAHEDGRSCTLLAPNRRFALQYSPDAESFYGHIYASDPRFEKNLIIYDLAPNRDGDAHLYVVGDAHLLSDSPYETDVWRYGSGRALTDFLQFAGLDDSQRQIIFIGDPFQLTRGKSNESALSVDYIQTIADCDISSVSLDAILPGMDAEPFVGNCIAVAQRLTEQRFNDLTLATDDDHCTRAPSEPSAWDETAQDEFRASPETVKYIAFSHARVNEINQRVREDVFGLRGELAPRDIIHIRYGLSATIQDDPERTVFVPPDSFAEVTAVDQDVDPLVQPLVGRDKPVVVPFLRVRARLLHDRQELSFLCLKDYLNAEKPEVDSDTALALHVSAQARFRAQSQAARRSPSTSLTVSEADDEDGPNMARARARFLRADPYLNAARLRFGYALTLHRAQGQRFDTIVAELDTGQGQYNEAYFRWLYTLFTVPNHRLVMFNAPEITPLSRANWDDRFARSGHTRSGNLIPYDPDAAEDVAAPVPDPIREPALRNLYRHIVAVTAPQGIHVAPPVQRQYQEVYAFRLNGKAACELRLAYNGRFQVTRIEPASTSPAEFADQVRRLLTSGVRFTDPFQRTLYSVVAEKLQHHAISIESVEHHKYQEVYHLKSTSGELTLQVHYDGNGFVSRVAPVAYSATIMLDAVRDALGL